MTDKEPTTFRKVLLKNALSQEAKDDIAAYRANPDDLVDE